ncbi:hypothetical protein [Gordonia sihwensis]|uniref:hypothetical protein n=1 Tax=Gordonia sihwensis TaxID=173559 RepID=UPI0005EFEFD2|nr:hypothetical protein [Gordonia sihwensis]KJR10301.1 hypothetical protein UG54_01620 [Gordonia sihwensis]
MALKKKPMQSPTMGELLSGLNKMPAPAARPAPPAPQAPAAEEAPTVDQVLPPAKPASDPVRDEPTSELDVARPAPAASATRLQATTKAKAAGESTYGKNRKLTLSLPLELKQGLRVRAKAEDRKYDDLIFDAIEEVYDRLPKLVSELRRTPYMSQLFARKPESSTAQRVALQIYTLSSNVAVLKNLADELDAADMSQVVEAALAAYL